MTTVERSDISTAQLHDAAAAMFAGGHRLALVAAHDDEGDLRVVYLFTGGPPDRRHELVVHLDAREPRVPTLSDLSFSASRFERVLHDDFAIEPVGHPFLRPLGRHQHWPEDWYPMRRDAGTRPARRPGGDPYPFTEVRGPGVYEIPVGPVHAGLIEPGHFRFSVVGETILKMTARLWFVHRGVERLFQGAEVTRGLELAQRISGDSTVAHSLAYCLAVEDAMGLAMDAESRRLRGVVLELERLYNHVGDVGALCNDVSFAVANACAATLRERILRINEEVTGHRLGRGAFAVGTTALLRLPSEHELEDLAEGFEDVVALAMSNSVVVDRFVGTATLSRDDAAAIGTLGPVARASGIAEDARWQHGFLADAVVPITQESGDVMARFTQRVEEFRASLDLIAHLIGDVQSLRASADAAGERLGAGVGVVEGWRGAVVHRIEIDALDRVTRARTIDPSFFNWPALSIALSDTIVPDFPLANKSFNLSYAGNDL